MGVIKYSVSNCLTFMGLGLIVGLISITFGLAGGFMANPFFIMIGFDPLVIYKIYKGICSYCNRNNGDFFIKFSFQIHGKCKFDQ